MPAPRRRGVDWPMGTAQRRLPKAGSVEGGRSEEVKWQTLSKVASTDIS